LFNFLRPAVACSYLTLCRLREAEEEEKKQGEKGSQENRNISCSESPQAVPSRPSGKCRLKARTNVDKQSRESDANWILEVCREAVQCSD